MADLLKVPWLVCIFLKEDKHVMVFHFDRLEFYTKRDRETETKITYFRVIQFGWISMCLIRGISRL